jgi:putative holliday junction resolvase
LDLGEAYSGVAISDPGGTLARPLEVMPSGRLEDRLRELFTEEAVAEVVIGVPKTLGGEVGFQAKWVLAKLDTLKSAFPTMRFVEWDERFTTRLAHFRDRQGRRKGGKRERVDHLAAAGMLQEYLDQRGALGSAQRGT